MHECPRCKQIQIPRLDINTPSNAIELDPNTMALYGEGLEDGGEDGDAPKGRVYGEHRRTWVYVDVIFHAAAPAGHLGSVLKAVVIDG